MRLSPRRPVLLLALCATFVTTVAVAPAAQAAAVNYVALGDSYSSGVGSGSYIAASGNCLRSTKAYSALWAAAHSPASYMSLACSGAKTTDVIGNQLGALSASTTLVSISIGGNDVGFSTVLTDCVVYGTSTCVSDINGAENQARTQLPARLASAYGAIRAHAPNARVVVLD